MLVGLVSIPLPACAQPDDPPATPTPLSVLDTIPFDYINHIFVRVTLNDSLGAVLVYDPVQGVLLDERFARRNGLPTFGGEEVGYGGPVTVGGAGSAQHTVTFARDLTVRDGLPTQPGSTFERSFPLTPVIPLDSMMAGALGRPVDGLFGIDLLAAYVLEFDFEHERFVLHDPGSFAPPPEASAVPITWMERGRKPAVPVTLHLTDDEQVDGLFLLDFGMGGALRLTTGFTETHNLSERISPTISSDSETGLGGALQSLFGRIQSVSIGTLRIEQPVLSMAQETEGADAYPEHDGLIGLGLLDRYRVFYDVPGEQLWLAPTPRAAEPYIYAVTGLRWEAVDRDAAGELIVHSVAPNSPAAEAGLQPGDQLLAVDDTDASGWTRREWQTMVDQTAAQESGQKTPVVLDVRILRSGTVHTVRMSVVRRL
ncbi:MAG: PDZ domain-containing protein [Rhodothermaceae bacterium]|nr:PDZ domain-containing protein [Rhodothermaceae bacterium]